MEISASFKIQTRHKGTKHHSNSVNALNFNVFLLFRKEGCEKCEFKVNEVYALDVLVSSGDGKVSNLKIFLSFTVA